MRNSSSRPSAVVLSGSGRYADPWHDFAATSARLAKLLDELGLDVAIHSTEDGPPDLTAVDLLVVNAGGGSTPTPDSGIGEARSAEALRRLVVDYARRGGPVLAVHTASNTFFEGPDWAEVIGGRWVPGVSMHPPADTTTVSVATDVHPITAGLADFVARDERYSYLQTSPDAVVLVTHEHDGVRHPVVWARESDGTRVVYDSFGHDVAAYELPGRADLLRREVNWLLAR